MKYLKAAAADSTHCATLRGRVRHTLGRLIQRGRMSALASSVLVAAAFLPMADAQAQAYPSRPIKILVGYGPGGTTDTLARFYAVKLQEVLNTPIIVDNKPGASEILAAQPVMNAPPDGYTLWMGTAGALAQNPGVRRDLPYDTLKNFAPIAMVAEAEAVLLVKANVPVSTLPEFIAYGKAHPGKLNYGSGGMGSGNHLQMEYLINATGASFTHVPYKSESEITRDMMGGNVDVAMLTAQIALPFVNDGKLKPIAVTGTQRLKTMPTVPSFAEAGVPELKAMGSYTFFAVMGPAGLPAPIIQRLNEAFNKVSTMPDVDQRLREQLQLRPKAATPEEYRQVLERELAKWRELGKTVKVSTT